MALKFENFNRDLSTIMHWLSNWFSKKSFF